MAGLNINFIAQVDNILEFQTRGNLLLIKPSPEDAPKTSGGILLPETSKDKEQMLARGEVIVVGSQVLGLTPGDTVFFFRGNSEGAVRQGNDIYFLFQDYAIKAVLNTPVVKVQADGEIKL